MSRRNLIRKYKVIDDVDSTTIPFSIPTDVSGVDEITYQISIDGGVDATLEVFITNDDKYSASDIIPLDFSQALPLDGSIETDYIVHIENKGFKWMLLRIGDNGGSGNVNAWISGTGKGA